MQISSRACHLQVVCSACASLARRLESLAFCSVSLGCRLRVACALPRVACVSPGVARVSLACRLRVACVLPCVTQSESAALGPQGMTFYPPNHHLGCAKACRLRVACVSLACRLRVTCVSASVARAPPCVVLASPRGACMSPCVACVLPRVAPRCPMLLSAKDFQKPLPVILSRSRLTVGVANMQTVLLAAELGKRLADSAAMNGLRMVSKLVSYRPKVLPIAFFTSALKLAALSQN